MQTDAPPPISLHAQGEGLFEGLDWLSNTLNSKRR